MTGGACDPAVTCAGCGAPLTRSRRGRQPSRCAACNRLRAREYNRAYYERNSGRITAGKRDRYAAGRDLTWAWRRVEKIEADLTAARAHRAQLIRRALDDGVNVAELARQLDVSRQAVYRAARQ